jgi:hypothetical protein
VDLAAIFMVSESSVRIAGVPEAHKQAELTRFSSAIPARLRRVRAKTLMDLPLPAPIASYVRAENSGDSIAISRCFAPCATVREDDEYIEGRPAIHAWKAMKPKQSITPLAIDVADGISTLKARIGGKHPGDPVIAELRFAVVNDQIVSLRIRDQSQL